MATLRAILSVIVLLSISTGSVLAQWVMTNNPFGDGYVRVNCFASIGSKIFAGCTGGGVFVSTDNGANWTAVNTGLKNKDIVSFAVRGATLYAGTGLFPGVGAGLYATTNEGTSWDSIHASISGPFASIGTRLFGAGFFGVFVSTNSGAGWTSVSTIYSGDLAVVDTTLFVCAYTTGAYRSTNYGGSWDQANVGLPAIPNLNAIFSNGKNLFAGVFNGGLYLSTDKGGTWNPGNNGLPNSMEWHCATTGTTIFLGTYGTGVYASNNDGANWTDVNSTLPNKFVRSIAVIGSYVFIGLYEGTVYRRPLSQMITSVNSLDKDVPLSYGLAQNYPNPFNPSTTIQFSIPKSGVVTLKVYNALGQEVSELISRDMDAGTYTSEWNASGCASGVYYYRLEAGSFVATRKVVLVK
jgi:photosystem II stability/assembly factor-like uncharacterized protein